MADIAHTLAAHPHWAWADGMLLAEDGHTRRWRIGGRSDEHAWWLLVGGYQVRHATLRTGEWTPALEDAATAGVLLGMLHDAQEHVVHVELWGANVEVRHGDDDHEAETLGEAAARALLATWGARD